MSANFANYQNMPVGGKKINRFKNISNLFGLQVQKVYIVLLNKNNSQIIENEINNNPDYNGNFARKIYEYHKMTSGGSFPEYKQTAALDVVRMIDFENSTQIWRFRNNRNYLTKMVDYIVDPYSNFWQDLAKGDIDLIGNLINASGASYTVGGPRSLASKICRYLSLYHFNADAYYVNDSVVRHVLPYYLNYYGLTLPSKNKTYFDHISYNDLHNYLEKIRSQICPNLTKEELDHLMWYCYKK